MKRPRWPKSQQRSLADKSRLIAPEVHADPPQLDLPGDRERRLWRRAALAVLGGLLLIWACGFAAALLFT